MNKQAVRGLIMDYINVMQREGSTNLKTELFTELLSRLKEKGVYQEIKLLTNFAYDNMITFGVKFNESLLNFAQHDDEGLDYAVLAQKLSTRELSGGAAKTALIDFFMHASKVECALMRICLQKSFECGLDEKTIRKVDPSILPQKVGMMKCEPATSKTLAKIAYPARLELKVDAMRFNAVIDLDTGTQRFVTYNGTPFNVNDKYLEGELSTIAKNFSILSGTESKTIYIDGELLVMGENGKPLPRKESNGLANRILKETAPIDVHERVRLVVWDALDSVDMELGQSRQSNAVRFEHMKTVLQGHKFTKISLVEHYIVDTEEAAHEQVEIWIKRGEEGGVIKNLDAKWEPKRSKDCVKFKAEREADMICTGFLPGDPTGNRAGGIGALIFESSDAKILVDVGGGLDKEEIFSDPKEFLNRIATIRFNEVISKKNFAQKSLFLPRIVEWRHDKDEADSYETIINL